MNTSIVSLQYNDQISVSFTNDAWFNATDIAKQYGKRPVDWLALESTKEYIANLCEIFKCEESSLLKTQRGKSNGGSWFSPKLAVNFARWLDVKFSIWCDMQIDKLLRPIPNALRDLPPPLVSKAQYGELCTRVHEIATDHKNRVALWSRFNSHFRISSYKDLPASKYEEAILYLEQKKVAQGELFEPSEPKLTHNAPTFSIGGVYDQTVIVRQHSGVTFSYVAEEGTIIGTPDNVIRELKLLGYHVVKDDPTDKLQTIVKIAGFVA